MKAALIGYGKMGRLLEQYLLEKKHEVIAIVDPLYRGAGDDIPSKAELYSSPGKALKGTNGKSLSNADVVLEFTNPEAAPENLLFLAREKIPAVTGTTGWLDRLDEISRAVNDNRSSLVWSSNFSLGVNLFYRIAALAAKMADQFPEYDVGAFETHHNKKADSPSGTAKALMEQVLAQMTRKKRAVYEMLAEPPAADEIHCSSLRVGSAPGIHGLILDSVADTIEITHTARNREGFTSGAVLAAQWLIKEKRTGVFTVEDILAEILPN